MYKSVRQYDVDEKCVYSEVVETPIHTPARPKYQVVTCIVSSILLLSTLCLLLVKNLVCQHHHDVSQNLRPFTDNEEWVVVGKNTSRVALEAHIMSKCPDAKYCLQNLVVPAMEQVADMVDFKLSYIGSVDPNSDDVSCMHGPSECLGNLIQLCAQEVYPDPKLFLGFANCMTADYPHIPERELVAGCAMEHGLDFAKLNSCISDEGHGMDLLRKSVERSQELHVRTSCTVRLQDRVRCVRDGGKWYDCPGGSDVQDLVDEIEKLYKQGQLERA